MSQDGKEDVRQPGIRTPTDNTDPTLTSDILLGRGSFKGWVWGPGIRWQSRDLLTPSLFSPTPDYKSPLRRSKVGRASKAVTLCISLHLHRY